MHGSLDAISMTARGEARGGVGIFKINDITTTKLHESKWRGTSHSFVLHWCDRVCTYEELVDPADHFTGNVKLIMLQNAVSGVPALHQVKTQSAHDIAHGGKALTFEQYKTLLLSAASAYDAGRGLSRSRPTCSINQADLTELPPVFEFRAPIF